MEEIRCGQFNLLFQHLPKEAKKNHASLRSVYTISGPNFIQLISRTQDMAAIHLTGTSRSVIL
jgi:hypothetical protein